MRTRSLQLFAVTAALALALPAVAASAEDEVGADVQFELQTSGYLSIALESTSTTVLTADGGGLLDIGGGEISGALPRTTVYDREQGLNRQSEVQISSTPFTHELYDEDGDEAASHPDLIIPASAGRASADLVSTVGNLLGGGVTLPGGDVNLGEGGTLVSATVLLGNGQYSFVPTVSVNVPATAPDGKYTGTVTQSVS